MSEVSRTGSPSFNYQCDQKPVQLNYHPITRELVNRNTGVIKLKRRRNSTSIYFYLHNTVTSISSAPYHTYGLNAFTIMSHISQYNIPCNIKLCNA